MKTRITLADSKMECLTKMVEGNPGALRVLADILEQTGKIDPRNMMGGLGMIASLDNYGIYGSQIWMLYKDVCGQSIPKMVACLRACQLGLLPVATLTHAIQHRGAGLDLAKVCTEVVQRLPSFQLNPVFEASSPATKEDATSKTVTS